MMDEDILDDFNDHFNGDDDYKKISDHFNDVDAYCSRVDVGRRYRGISYLIYEAVINQGVTLHFATSRLIGRLRESEPLEK